MPAYVLAACPNATDAVPTGHVPAKGLREQVGCAMQRRLSRLLVYNDARHDFDEAFMFPLQPRKRNLRPNKARWHLPEGFTPFNAKAYYNLWRGADDEWREKLEATEQAEVSSASRAGGS
jgi:hypothetical protein